MDDLVVPTVDRGRMVPVAMFEGRRIGALDRRTTELPDLVNVDPRLPVDPIAGRRVIVDGRVIVDDRMEGLLVTPTRETGLPVRTVRLELRRLVEPRAEREDRETDDERCVEIALRVVPLLLRNRLPTYERPGE